MTMVGAQIDDLRTPRGLGGIFYGVYPALVTDVVDPEGQGRVRIRLPWAADTGDAVYEHWAPVATLMAGAGRGTWFIPEVDDEVLVAFGGGDPRHPYVIGALWNGSDSPPEDIAPANDVRAIHSRSGVKIRIEDTAGAEKLTLETPGGHTIVMDDGGRTIEVTDSNTNTVTFDSGGITVTASSKVSINASTVDVSAGSVSVNAGMSRFSGVVQADTVITNSVVSTSYTPGAGNIW